ncbi:hypothetical protein JCM15519_31220 [Fundidesulfovibrio butyratiphilus]
MTSRESDTQGCGPASTKYQKREKTYAYDHLVRLLDTYSAKSVYGSAFCKRPITVQLLIRDAVIVDMGVEMDGCAYCRQCLGALVHMVKGLDVGAAWNVTADALRRNLEEPDPDIDCEVYVVAALKLALRNWEKQIVSHP